MRGSETDDGVDRDAAEEVEEESGVDSLGLVLQLGTQARKEHEKVHRVAREDRDGVLDPPARGHFPEDGRLHGLILAAEAPRDNRNVTFR